MAGEKYTQKKKVKRSNIQTDQNKLKSISAYKDSLSLCGAKLYTVEQHISTLKENEMFLPLNRSLIVVPVGRIQQSG